MESGEFCFKNREEAALILARKLDGYKNKKPLVLGVPRGAVPMARIIADHLNGDLDLVLVHKVGHPDQPEYAVAAVTEDGQIMMGEGARDHGVTIAQIKHRAAEEIKALKRKRDLYTPHRSAFDPSGRTVIVVDDGIATGATMSAAIRAIQSKGAKEVVVATPVSSQSAIQALRGQGIKVESLLIPPVFFAVGQFYDDFSQVTDEEVIAALRWRSQAEANMREVAIDDADVALSAYLSIPLDVQGLVLFAHGSGSGRKSPRNQFVADKLNEAGIATLLADLLEEAEAYDRSKVFAIDLLARRLGILTEWCMRHPQLANLPLAYFGASTGAAAALLAAARNGDIIRSVVSRGGRPDLAGQALRHVVSPTLLIVGGADEGVIELNEEAYSQLECEKKLEVIPGASHLFEEPGALEVVADLARTWFADHFADHLDHSAKSPHLPSSKITKKRKASLRL